MKKTLLIGVIFGLIFTLASCKKKAREIDIFDLSVRDAYGKQGMVSTASAYATEVGLNVLKQGGNAFDAAAAIAFTLNVTEPNATGIGGGGFFLGFDAEKNDVFGYEFREFAPGLATRERYIESQLVLSDGVGSIGVPMFVDGILTVLENHGTLSRSDVISPAISLAQNGFKVSPTLASAINDNFNKLMRSRSQNLSVYSKDGITGLQTGDTLINAALASTLTKIKDEGRAGFYQGEVAEAIVAEMETRGGFITLEDLTLAMNRTIKTSPVTGRFHDLDLYSVAPPSSGGVTLIEMLNMLENESELAALGHNTAPYIHRLSTAMLLAYSDRQAYIGDPRFTEVPVLGLTDKTYARSRWDLFVENQKLSSAVSWVGNPIGASISSFMADEPYEGSGSTTHFSVIDKHGNIASLTSTINHFFGSGIVPAGTGFLLNNELDALTLDETDSINVVKPYKVPLSSMAPVLVMQEGKPLISVGSPGSQRIMAANMQVILNVALFNMDLQTAIEKPRVFIEPGINLMVEGGIDQSVVDTLTTYGYSVTLRNPNDLYFGGVQGIYHDLAKQQYHGAADRRRDGKALGY